MGNIDGQRVHLIEKFNISKKDEPQTLKQEWKGDGMNLRWPKMTGVLKSGALRCAVGTGMMLEDATLVVYYK